MKNFSSFEELAADSMSSSDATPPAFGDIQNIITDATENMGTLDRHAGYNIFIFEGNDHEGHIHFLKGKQLVGKAPLDLDKWVESNPDYKVRHIPKGDLKKLRNYIKEKAKGEGENNDTQREEIAGQEE